MSEGLRARGLAHAEQRDAQCCYVRADKLWVTDRNGISWELYVGKGSIEVFGDDARPATNDACCAGDAGTPSCPFLRSDTELPRSEGRSPVRSGRLSTRAGVASDRA